MLGFFISFEGPDGSGKTTQIGLLKDYLESKGLQVVLTREPGGTLIGEKIRSVLLDPANTNMDYKCEIMLYAAARAQLLAEVIYPSIQAGKVVLCDRFIHSTIAYQGHGRGLDLEMIEEINRITVGNLQPDITFLLDVPPEVGIPRAIEAGKKQGSSNEGDRLENEAVSFHQRVRHGYLGLAEREPERIVMIDGTQEVEKIHKSIIQIMGSFLARSSE